MSNLQAEIFIRKQIQRILLENTEDENETEKPKESSSSGGRVFGSVGRGRLPKEIAEIFAGEDGSAAEPKRLASTNPAKLMKNLKVSRGNGNTTLERAMSLIANAQQGTEAFGQAIGAYLSATWHAGGIKGYPLFWQQAAQIIFQRFI